MTVPPSPATSGTTLSVDIRTFDPFTSFTLPYYLVVKPKSVLDAHPGIAETMRVDSSSTGTRAGTVDITVLQNGTPGAGSVQVDTVLNGGGGSNEQQSLLVAATSGTYKLGFRGVNSGNIAWNGNDAAIQTALNATSSISAYADVDIAEVVAGGNGVNAQQSIAVIATGGTFKLSLRDGQTGAIAWNAGDAGIQTALEGLLGVGNVTVSGGVITFANDWGDTSVPLLVADVSTLTGTGSVTVSSGVVTFGGGLLANRNLPALVADTTLLVNSANQANEKVLITPTGDAGAYTLTFGGNTTAAINFNDTAGTVDTRLEALASIGAGQVVVTGTAGGPYTVEFIGTLAGTNVGAITATVTTMTVNTRSFTVVRARKGSTARSIVAGDVVEVAVMPLRPEITVTPDAATLPVLDVTALPMAGGEALVTRNVAAGFPVALEYPAAVFRDSAGTIVFQTYPIGAVSGLTAAAGDNSTKLATTEYVDRGGGDAESFAFFLGG